MAAIDALLTDLECQLWHGGLPDEDEPQQVLLQALRDGATYHDILRSLRKLWRMALPGYMIATRARLRWPGSIDIALLAVEFALPQYDDRALGDLEESVLQGNRRRSALAHAYLRLARPDKARAVLEQIDPRSPTAAADIQHRIDLTLNDGDFERARSDIAWLDAHGFKTAARTLTLKLSYRQHGARAISSIAAQSTGAERQFQSQAFEIFLNEGDHGRARRVLTQSQNAGDTREPALARMQSRFALECGESQTALAMLKARLDLQQPWAWTGGDHVQWLRAGLATQSDHSALQDHAIRALRLHPRNDGLEHVAGMVHEAAIDWRDLERARSMGIDSPERALVTARAALRMGLAARSLGMIAIPRRSHTLSDTLRAHILRAEAFTSAGRLRPAQRTLALARTLTCNAPQLADITILEADIALAQGALPEAAAALTAIEDAFPDRMPLWLARARLAFQSGDFQAALQALARFNTLKSVQIGAAPVKDLRDRIIEDAAHAAAGAEGTFTPLRPARETITQAGFARIAASPGLSACLLSRALKQGELSFIPVPDGRIPRQIAHYWQGPPGPALPRALAQWRELHPDFETLCFDQVSAIDWLSRHYDPRMVARFNKLEQPAARADLFRLCWITQAGGVFTDLDEYPRLPITPWLTDAQAVLCVEQGFGTIANNFIAAEAGHPLCQNTLALACEMLDHAGSPYPWWHTGPAQWTRATFMFRFGQPQSGLRLLSQDEYNRRVATNLPYPHKRSPDHWR